MKKYLVLIAVIMLSLGLASNCFAEVREQRTKIGSAQIWGGPCKLIGFNMYSATAGDIVGVYDTTNSGYPITSLEFEFSIASNTSSISSTGWEAPFVNGIRTLCKNSASVVTVVLDY